MRLLLVWQADAAGAYAWMPSREAGDVVVSFDVVATADLRDRDAQLYDDLISWDRRAAAERRVSRLLGQLRDDEGFATLGLGGHRLTSFVEFRARGELVHLLRGFDTGQAARGCRAVVADPALPDAVVVGVRAALGLDVWAAAYAPEAPAVKPPPLRRLWAGSVMRGMAAVTPTRGVRVAAVLNAKVAPAVAALAPGELRAAGLAAMPFPGLDYGNSARVAARLRIPLLATLDPLVGRRVARPNLPRAFELRDEDAHLSAGVQRVMRGLLESSWPTFVDAVHATRALERLDSLRALLLPTTAVGVSRLLLDWAHRRDIAVAAVQHGVYGFKEHDGGDSRADVLLAWSERVCEQTRGWPEPRPRIVAIGVPGMAQRATRRRRAGRPLRVLVATTWRPTDSALVPTSFHEQFVAVIAPGLRMLMEAGASVELRLHPIEDREVYRRILRGCGLSLPFAPPMAFPEAAARVDLLVSGPSSVAFEAGALGLAVLLWNSAIPPALRTAFLVPPLSLDLPGTFGDAAQFEALVADVLAGGEPAPGVDLAADLGSYAAPFDAPTFARALRDLGS